MIEWRPITAQGKGLKSTLKAAKHHKNSLFIQHSVKIFECFARQYPPDYKVEWRVIALLVPEDSP
ncbi:hypothetical protein ACFQAT_02190 [Undibacterium arcticum]|uniref:Uncharacterized protein n=1 Tax=Undibacterium arcticum TaxID=1762892 RepID=A0ABV7F2F5_9BURK